VSFLLFRKNQKATPARIATTTTAPTTIPAMAPEPIPDDFVMTGGLDDAPALPLVVALPSPVVVVTAEQKFDES
jgi:hypothetical protein